MKRSILSLIILFSLTFSACELFNEKDKWSGEVIYFMLTDRFADGDTSNNSQIEGSWEYLPGDGKKYQGGDFKGITSKLDYLQELGITTLWITSPVKQTWENSGYASYHGYWAQDFSVVDPHLGTLEDLQELVNKAHEKNIKVIIDVVLNHMGSLFYYGNEGNQWEPTYNEAGYELTWLDEVTDFSSWVYPANRVKPGPVEFQNADWFSRKGGNATSWDASEQEVLYGDFAGLRDINTLNPDVREKLKEIFKNWIIKTGIDGFRLDTVKHVEKEFWSDFCNEIRTWALSEEGGNKNFFLIGEVYEGNPEVLSEYTVNNALDSVLGFNMGEAVFGWNNNPNNSVFKGNQNTVQIQNKLEATIAANGFGEQSLHDNGDGLTARQKLGYFIDNHDLYRFLNDGTNPEKTEEEQYGSFQDTKANVAASELEIKQLQCALAWLLTWEGVPVIYYGTEQNYKQSRSLHEGGEQGNWWGPEVENDCEKGNRPRLWKVQNANNNFTAFDTTNSTFKLIKGLNSIRKEFGALTSGEVQVRWSDVDGQGDDKGIIAYLRKAKRLRNDILVVINTSDNDATPKAVDPETGITSSLLVDWKAGTKLEVIDIPEFDDNFDGTIDNQEDASVIVNSTLVNTVVVEKDSNGNSFVNFTVPAHSFRILKKK